MPRSWSVRSGGEGGVRQELSVGMWGGEAPCPLLPLTVEELRLDTEELLLSMRSSEGPGSGAPSPFSKISDIAWIWGEGK